MAYTLANGLAYVDELQRRGGDVEKFAKRLSFFFYVHMDFFDEIAKFRAGRRLWARFMKERYGGAGPEGAALPLRRGVRRLVAGRAAALQQRGAGGGGNDGRRLRRCAVDLHLRLRRGLPDPDRVLGGAGGAHAADRSRTRAASRRTVDPLGGSYFLEQHTDRMEEMIVKVMDEIDAYGGVVPAIEDGWIQLRLAERGLERKLDTDSGKAPVVGQNYFRKADEKIGVGDVFKLDPTVAQRALEKFEAVLDTRSQSGGRCLARQARSCGGARTART